jgi:hypothetical protein
MIECLLSLGANPNYLIHVISLEETPWLMLLRSIQTSLNRCVQSVHDFPKQHRLAVEALIVNGANLDTAWKFYGPKFTNRFGSRVQMGDAAASIAFADGFFKDLKNLTAKHETKAKQPKKWFKFH